MATSPKDDILAKEPKKRKRGGKLSGNRSHQGSAATHGCAASPAIPTPSSWVPSRHTSEVPSAMRRWPSTASTPKTSPLLNAGAYAQRVLFEQTSTFFNTLDSVLQELSDEMALDEP